MELAEWRMTSLERLNAYSRASCLAASVSWAMSPMRLILRVRASLVFGVKLSITVLPFVCGYE